MNRAKRDMHGRPEQGAAAVEFALVSTLLFLVLFGIIQYGLYFNDSLNARQGVREAARMGVVENFATSTTCTAAATNQAKLKCTVIEQIAPLTGTAYAKITTPDGWVKGGRLIVCGAIKESATFGFVPMPNNNWIYSKTQMSIEQTAKNAVTAWAEPTADTPSGIDWTAAGC